ncbi:MAG: NAD-dependent epimerase/dehydratase family protein, partial [Planctomycetes bacterium]|nr:NAD-dependent epimerase/dehydratase family protein [Planctomycetota bacterium]
MSKLPQATPDRKTAFMGSYLSNKRVCVTGGAGFLGRVVCRRLRELGVADLFVPRSTQYDLTEPETVRALFKQTEPDIVIHLAAEVGGIGANRRSPGRFFFANMAMGLNLIEEARRRGIDKFVQVGTACSYPEKCKVPFHEDRLRDGYPDKTNAPYGIAKRALGVMLDAYREQYEFKGIYLIPANLFGPEDNFNLETSHVIPALIRKFCDAVDNDIQAVRCWGSGKVTREFLYVDDAAEDIVTATSRYDGPQAINLG